MTGESDPPGIDGPPVTDWFAVHVAGVEPPLRFDRVAGGHSCLTFVVTDAAGRRYVLRRPPLGHVLATAHNVVREHRIMNALEPTDVPVPRMLGVCEDADVNGAPFFVMAFVAGPVLHTPDAARELPDDGARRRAAETLVDALAALHAVDIEAVGLGDAFPPTGYLARQLKRWSSQWASSKTRELPTMEQLHAWLVEHRPAEREVCIVHGDFRLGNMIHGPDGTVLAVLDWELCTAGDPLADVSYLLRTWSMPGSNPAAATFAVTTAPGFPRRDEVIDRYRAASGRSLADLDYWLAFNAWRSAAINEGVYRRYIDGNMGETPPEVEMYARSTEALALAGLESVGLA